MVHLWEAGFGADLDELLTRLALRHPGTRAVRAPLARSGAWLRQLRRPAEPLLLATQHGRTVGVMPVAEIAALAEGGGGGAGGESDVSSDFGDSDGEVSLVRPLPSSVARLCNRVVSAAFSCLFSGG